MKKLIAVLVLCSIVLPSCDKPPTRPYDPREYPPPASDTCKVEKCKHCGLKCPCKCSRTTCR